MDEYTTLQVIWFVLIAVLWIGYFVLEGFDFGVGMLMRVVGRTESERRAVLHSIGPLWDGNEVWLLVAGGATFAAFPQWYATLFSGFYLALFLILVALIVRNVAFEFWGKGDNERWRTRWEWAIMAGSFLPASAFSVHQGETSVPAQVAKLRDDQLEVAVKSLRAVLTAEQLAEVESRATRAARQGSAGQPQPALGTA